MDSTEIGYLTVACSATNRFGTKIHTVSIIIANDNYALAA